MALQTSGAISINDIATEFGGTTPHGLSEYYGVASGIPASGTIDISDFYGASAGLTGSASTTMGVTTDNNSCTYLAEDRLGFGVTNKSDFYYPENCSPYYSGYGYFNNSSNFIQSGSTVTMFQTSKMTSYPDTGRILFWFGIEGGSGTNSGWTSIQLTGNLSNSYSTTLTFNRSNAFYFTHYRLSSNNVATIYCWAWDNNSAHTYYDADVANARYMMEYYVPGYSYSATITITINY